VVAVSLRLRAFRRVPLQSDFHIQISTFCARMREALERYDG
jgi:hypothetical protein